MAADISYQIRYCEENHRDENQPWSTRQTGIYHHHSPSDKFDLFILLNPYPVDECILEQQICNLSTSPKSVQSLVANPYRMHTLLFALYSDNWRWYFRYISDGFMKRVTKIPFHTSIVKETDASVSE